MTEVESVRDIIFDKITHKRVIEKHGDLVRILVSTQESLSSQEDHLRLQDALDAYDLIHRYLDLFR